MFKLLLAFLVILLIVLIFHFATKKYLNPYQLTMVFGPKGSGKSTLLVKTALKYKKMGWAVFSNCHIPDTFDVDFDDIGVYELPRNCCILLDEAGTEWDNRYFKSFKPEVRDWFKYQRHRRIRVFLFSQTFDVDKKIRDLTDDMYLVQKYFRVFSYSKRIIKQTVLNKSTAESPSNIAENLVYDSLLLFWCGSRQLTYIPHYIKYFDSYESKPLKEKEYVFNPPLPVIKQPSISQRVYDFLYSLDVCYRPKPKRRKK